MKKSLFYLCAVTVLFHYGCSSSDQHMQQQATPELPVITIKTSTAALATQYPATLQGEQNVEIRSKIDGYIEKVFVSEGSRVKKGQPLFAIDANSYKQEVNSLKAAVLAAEANLETASIEVKRTNALVEKKIINEFELTSARNTERVRKAEMRQAQANLSGANSKLGFTTITSPIDGVVGSLLFKTGTLVSAAAPEPLTTIANTKEIEAYFSLSQDQLQIFLQQFPGSTITDKLSKMPGVELILPDGSLYDHKGKIQTLSGVLDKTTGAANFKAIFANPNGQLWSGASATLKIPQQQENAIQVPKKSTYEVQGRRFVYKLGEKNLVQNTEIEVLEIATETDYIVTKGIAAGDKIVSEGLGTLKDKMPIKPNVKL
jgi:membrane fusion protein (multidrug efflux system)